MITARLSIKRLCFACLIALYACQLPQTEAVNSTTKPKFYDVSNFINIQVEWLNEHKPKVEKILKINAKTEKNSTRNLIWQKELAVFLQADINKPAWKNSYNISQMTTHEGVKRYHTARYPNLPVQKLTLILDHSQKHIIALEASLKKENEFYKSEKTIALKCKKLAADRYVISQYKVEGKQQIYLFNQETYKVEANLLH